MNSMSTNFFRHPLVVITFFFILLFAFFSFGPAFPISVLTQPKGQPLVVEGTGKATAVPDVATVSMGIEQAGTSLTQVEQSVSSKSKTLVEAMKKLGISDSDIQTTSYNVSPSYNYKNQPPNVTGYSVSVTYDVKIKNFDKVNDALAAATQAGATNVGSVNFEVDDQTKNKTLDQARADAVKDAKTKAESLAKAASVTLGRILNISETPVTTPVPLPLTAGGGTLATPEQNVQIQPGETEFSVSVSLTYEIR